jgi:hypothetical protein
LDPEKQSYSDSGMELKSGASNYEKTQTMGTMTTFESLFSMTMNEEEWIELNNENQVFVEILNKIKRTFEEVNKYLTSSYNFLVSLILKNDEKKELIEYIKNIQDQDPAKSDFLRISN